jgi:pterin-4a-carbinolamine dehydratase
VRGPRGRARAAARTEGLAGPGGGPGGEVRNVMSGVHGSLAHAAPFASVITPTLGRPASLLRALASVQAQDMADWELIVADDGDGEGVAAAEALGDARIRACRSAGVGQVDARNTALALARGAFVCWLDDDDWWQDGGHLSLLRRETGGREFAFRGGWIVYEEGSDRAGRREVYDHPASERSLRTDNTILTSSIAYPRAAHRELGVLDRELGGYCDWDFMLRMCDAGYAPRRLAGLGVCYSIHGSNASGEVASPARRAGFERFAAKHGLEIEIASHLEIHRMLLGMSVPEGWSEVDGALEREFAFAGFPEAIAFVNRVAELAEAENHHPDISVAYNRVTLRWRTHSAEAITDRDRELARRSATLL